MPQLGKYKKTSSTGTQFFHKIFCHDYSFNLYGQVDFEFRFRRFFVDSTIFIKLLYAISKIDRNICLASFNIQGIENEKSALHTFHAQLGVRWSININSLVQQKTPKYEERNS